MTEYVTVVTDEGTGFAEVLEGDCSQPREVGPTLSPEQLCEAIADEQAGRVSFDTPDEIRAYRDPISWLIAHGAEPGPGFWSGQIIYTIEYWQ